MRTMIQNLNNHYNEEVQLQGWVHRIRKLRDITFLILRDRTGLVQCVFENTRINHLELRLESVVSITGTVKEGKNNLHNFEIQGIQLELLSSVHEELPIAINTPELQIGLDTLLNHRTLSLRHERNLAIFKIQNLLVQSFRSFLTTEGFTEIFTPKLVSEGAEGGTDMFEVKYFEQKAYLAQSPQFYKQMMVGVFERVFEIGHVYRAERHNTNRHLNEYISMDLEFGFITDETDLMNLEESLLKHMLQYTYENASEAITTLGVQWPLITTAIPRMKLSEAISILKEVYHKTDLEGDLDPEGEKLICQYAKEHYGSDFIFLTHYPRTKRPMYTMPCGEHETHSFDLLFRGVEITTGGQRIHTYEDLIANMHYKGLEPSNYESYTNTFKYGMPPHGGLAIGLERLTSRLLELENIREATLIPKDRTRLTP
ncbi:MAG: aspartate--tRNA(Asn) ligase [Cellulosilyticaceae bacterium]